jgi:molecular chaperone GrpE
VTAAQGGPSGTGQPEQHEPQEPLVIRDKRRVNPLGTTGEAGTVPPSPPAGDEQVKGVSKESEEVRALTTQLEERTADLQRLKAEYDNYRRRVERDRQAGADQATAKVLMSLLGVLDDIDRAVEHSELEGNAPLRAVATGLKVAVDAIGLEQYGQAGDPFDPQVHEALVHTFQPGLEGPTCVEIYRSGYRYAGRVLRPAQVVVADPPAPEESADGST